MEWMPCNSSFDGNLSISDILMEIHTSVKLPHNWFSDTITKSNKLTITFIKMGSYNENYQRLVEKQLIVNSGNFYNRKISK